METLEDRLRRTTRNSTVRLPEEELFAVGRDLARELARAHAESPARHPELDPAAIPISDDKIRLEGGRTQGENAQDLFDLGALLCSLALGSPAEVSWRLDGPPPPEVSTLVRRDVLMTLASPRRETRFATATAAADALDAALAPIPATPSAWPLFRGNCQRTGHAAPADGVAPVNGFEPVWEVSLGAVVASPVLSHGLVVAATSDGRLVFLDRATGRTIHEMRIGTAGESSPGIDNQVLFIGNDDGELIAVDLVTGRERYRAAVGSLVRSSPLVVGDRILVGTVDNKTSGGLVCLDMTKGRLLWKTRCGAVFSSPALSDKRVLVGSDDGRLHAMDIEKGTVLWSHELGAKVRATPALIDDLALVGDFGGRLAAIRIADGTRSWMAELGHPVYASVGAVNGAVVVGCNEGHIHGLDLATGASRFEVPTRGPVVGSPAVLEGRCVLGSTDGDLLLLDPTGGVVARRTLSKAGIQSSPAVDGAFLCVGSGAGLHAVRLRS